MIMKVIVEEVCLFESQKLPVSQLLWNFLLANGAANA